MLCIHLVCYIVCILRWEPGINCSHRHTLPDRDCISVSAYRLLAFSRSLPVPACQPCTCLILVTFCRSPALNHPICQSRVGPQLASLASRARASLLFPGRACFASPHLPTSWTELVESRPAIPRKLGCTPAPATPKRWPSALFFSIPISKTAAGRCVTSSLHIYFCLASTLAPASEVNPIRTSRYLGIPQTLVEYLADTSLPFPDHAAVAGRPRAGVPHVRTTQLHPAYQRHAVSTVPSSTFYIYFYYTLPPISACLPAYLPGTVPAASHLGSPWSWMRWCGRGCPCPFSMPSRCPCSPLPLFSPLPLSSPLSPLASRLAPPASLACSRWLVHRCPPGLPCRVQDDGAICTRCTPAVSDTKSAAVLARFGKPGLTCRRSTTLVGHWRRLFGEPHLL
ncbi:hypothetical protein F4780DRAFT_316766 [Xylariomycetidae sp. FL0641]|nr:hypothetical protein F4780DRAFT_316766 [Xylariomycetidae sp. FL0641]